MKELTIFIVGLTIALYVMPLLDSVIGLINNTISVKIQKQQILLNVFNMEEMSEEKAPLIGFDVGDGESNEDCPQECQGCTHREYCDDVGYFDKIKTDNNSKSENFIKSEVNKSNTPIGKSLNRIGF